MEEDKLKESKKILTNYMLELNRDIQSAEEWANTGADEEMYFAIQTVLNELERLQKKNEELNIRLQEEINEKCKLKTELYLNSIPKSVIEDKIDVLEKIQKEFKNNEELRIKIITYKELLNKGE